MSHTTPPHATTATKITLSTLATNADLERFFGSCGDDTRRKIFSHLGLPKRRKRPWGEVWAALGLDSMQTEEMWDQLTLGRDGKNKLWDAARVAEETGLVASTINNYCRSDQFPEDFPRPLISMSPKTRLWLPLEVQAYNRPSLYGAKAANIRRKPTGSTVSKNVKMVSYTGTAQPLPPSVVGAG
jgi:hypothetical protein